MRVPGGWVSGRYRPPFKEPAGWSVVAIRWRKPRARWGAGWMDWIGCPAKRLAKERRPQGSRPASRSFKNFPTGAVRVVLLVCSGLSTVRVWREREREREGEGEREAGRKGRKGGREGASN